MTVGVLGFGGYAPERIMTNDDWSELIDTDDEWITARTGIKRRRFAADDESTADLAMAAAEQALADAGMAGADLDEIVVATDTPEVYTPDTAAFLQHRLGAGPVTAYDLGGSGCAGWVLALDVARARIEQSAKRVLVVGVELISRLMNWDDRATAVLFGDAAGAVVLGPEAGKAELIGALAGTDGSRADILTLEAGGTRLPFNEESFHSGAYKKVVMNGREVFKDAVRRMSAACRDVVASVGLTMDDVDLVVPHQANKRIIDAVGSKLDLSEDRVYVNVDEYGNTGSASVPFALSEARHGGRIDEGDTVLLTAFGAGFHWAAAVLQF